MQMDPALKYFHDALLKAYKFAKKKRDKEHVTTFIRNNRKLFRIKCLEPKLGLNFPYLKFDINTSKDLFEKLKINT